MNKVWRWYGALLLLHAVHIAEEARWHAWFIESLYGGLLPFLLVNGLLLSIPLLFSYAVYRQNRWAYRFASLYAIVMMVDGIEHLGQWFWRGSFTDGAAGAVSGLGFLFVGAMLLRQIRREKRSKGGAAYIPALRYRFLTPLYDFLCAAGGFGKRFRQCVLAAVPGKRGRVIVDIGCGTGTMTRLMRQRWPTAKVVGIDPDEEILRIARRKAERAHRAVEYRQATAQQLPFASGSVDVVTSTLVFHHLKTSAKQAALQEIRRVLKPSGAFVLTDFGKPKHRMLAWLGLVIAHLEEGDDNIKGRLPALLQEAGFKQVTVRERPRWNVDILVARK